MAKADKLPRWLIVILVVASLGVAIILAQVILALVPTDLDRLEGEIPAFVDDGRRAEKRGCGLTELEHEGGCAPARAAARREVQVRFPATTALGPRELKGTLLFPEGLPPRRPAVVLVHGSGPSTRDAELPGDLLVRLDPPLPVFRALAEELVDAGFVVLRYDKRSCRSCYADVEWRPDPVGYYDHFSFLHFARDAEAALAYLRTLPEVDPARLVVIGHSQGAAFLPEIVEGEPGVAAAVWLAGFTGPFSGALLGQLDELARIRAAQHDYLSGVTLRLSRDALAACFAKLDDPAADLDEVCIGGGVRQRALREYEAHTTTTRARLDTLGVPALFVQGTLDRNAPKDELVRLREDLQGDVELRSIAGLTHALTERRNNKLSPALVEALLGFLGSVGRD